MPKSQDNTQNSSQKDNTDRNKNRHNSPIVKICLLYTSDAADEARSVDLGGRRSI
ncbi:hypothetical protein PVA38_08740 [Streptococcus pneumoniae D39]|nr:hypothetical protein PVA38_08740 [Streptococcus pneumoniae D39]